MNSIPSKRIEPCQLRTGHWEFEQYRDRIMIEQPQVLAAAHTTDNLALELMASVRNDTGPGHQRAGGAWGGDRPARGTMSEAGGSCHSGAADRN